MHCQRRGEQPRARLGGALSVFKTWWSRHVASQQGTGGVSFYFWWYKVLWIGWRRVVFQSVCCLPVVNWPLPGSGSWTANPSLYRCLRFSSLWMCFYQASECSNWIHPWLIHPFVPSMDRSSGDSSARHPPREEGQGEPVHPSDVREATAGFSQTLVASLRLVNGGEGGW